MSESSNVELEGRVWREIQCLTFLGWRIKRLNLDFQQSLNLRMCLNIQTTTTTKTPTYTYSCTHIHKTVEEENVGKEKM